MLIVARLFGVIAVKLGEPRVMGEVIAGLVLGPSLLGAISPNLQATFFPSDILPALGVVANLGLDLLHVPGRARGRPRPTQGQGRAGGRDLERERRGADAARHRGGAAALQAASGPDKKFVAFALFMGVAMSITAFPVLARILAERRMIKRPVGALTIACAAIDDVTAWFLIALATDDRGRRAPSGTSPRRSARRSRSR